MSKFIVNGQLVQAETNQKLLPYLRDVLHITSAKNGCMEGACGTCMVLVDGVAKKSCVLSTAKLNGKVVTTVEGLSENEKKIYSYAFAQTGAVQCGFCTPGMVISAKALLDVTPTPSIDQIKYALRNNICRCTGYAKIIEAVQLAGKLLRDKIPVPTTSFKGQVGEKMHRVDALDKTLGKALYVDDLYVDGMLYGSSVRSQYPRALIKSIDTTAANALDGVKAVITAKDLPGAKKVGHIKKDWDILIDEGETTRYLGDALVLIAATTKEILSKAKELISIECEVLKPITCPEEALAPNAPPLHEGGNILSMEHLVRGHAEAKIKDSKFVVTNRYTTPFTEHAFLEPETALAIPDGDGMLIYCADQGIYQTRKECAEALGLKDEDIKVVSKTVGGGFGGKEDMSVQHHAAILAFLTGAPVKVSLSRQESMLVHPKRHAMDMEFTTACDENGQLTAMKAVIISDTGAYASLGGPVLQRACTHAAGPYHYQDIDILGKAIYTNNPPGGAFRGFGVTQSCYAIESNINELAEKVGLSPWEFRYKNAIRPGQTLPNGQIADDYTAFVETLEAVKEIYDQSPDAGIACAMKNSGLGVGIPDTGRCRLIVKDGMINTYTSAACIGQGLATVMTQMICEVLGITPDKIIHHDPDTSVAPNSGNTTASRQTVFTGEATRIAAMKLKDLMVGHSLEALEGEEAYGEYSCVTDPMGSDKPHPYSHVTYGYATHLVTLDEDGFLDQVIAAHDVGTAINPVSIEGQIQGGVVMSLGYALTEDYPLVNSVPQAKFATLGLLKANQVPDVTPIIVGKPSNGLAHGAKGIGEICSIPTAPAVALAYYKRDGIRRYALPIVDTPYVRKNRKK